MKKTLVSAFSLRIFFYSMHCLCYLSKKLENTISFPNGFFLFHLENIDFAPPCDSYAAQVNMALFNICPSLCSAIKFTIALGEKPAPLLVSSIATTQCKISQFLHVQRGYWFCGFAHACFILQSTWLGTKAS